jgi:hypothetical protein
VTVSPRRAPLLSRVVFLLALPALVAGCAHPIVITPDVTRLDARGIKPIDANVGYFIGPDDRDRQVVTPGGGGDTVAYYPYKELEPGLFRVLSNVFRRAYPLASTNDAAMLSAKDISFVLIPSIKTDSSSESVFTWPPTKFRVELSCRAVDRGGQVVWDGRVVGDGEATYEEFVTDMPLAARRASLSALTALQNELNAAASLRRR